MKTVLQHRVCSLPYFSTTRQQMLVYCQAAVTNSAESCLCFFLTRYSINSSFFFLYRFVSVLQKMIVMTVVWTYASAAVHACNSPEWDVCWVISGWSLVLDLQLQDVLRNAADSVLHSARGVKNVHTVLAEQCIGSCCTAALPHIQFTSPLFLS